LTRKTPRGTASTSRLRGKTLPGLGTLFPGLTPVRFRRQYWPLRPLDRHGPAARLSGLADLPQLNRIESLLAAHRGPTKTLSTNPQGEHFEVPADPERAIILYKLGTPLCLGDVNHSVPSLNLWREALARELDVVPERINCSAYASPSGHGVPKHFDNREIIVVQLRGVKRWVIEPNTEVENPTQNYGPGASWNWKSYRELGTYCERTVGENGQGIAAVIEMRAGSVLFLPRGAWHTTMTEEDSLSVTFGIFTPTAADLLLSALRARLIRQVQWRRPIVAPLDEKQANLAQAQLSGLVDQWPDEAEGVTADELLGQLTKPR